MITKGHLGPIWYHSESSDLPYSPNQFLGWDFFFHVLQQDSTSMPTDKVVVSINAQPRIKI